MRDEHRKIEKETETLQDIFQLAWDNGFFVQVFSKFQDTYTEIEGDYGEGDWDMEHVDRIIITRSEE